MLGGRQQLSAAAGVGLCACGPRPTRITISAGGAGSDLFSHMPCVPHACLS